MGAPLGDSLAIRDTDNLGEPLAGVQGPANYSGDDLCLWFLETMLKHKWPRFLFRTEFVLFCFFKNKKSGGKTEKEKKKENQTSSMTRCCFSYLTFKFFPYFPPKMIAKWKKTRKEALSTQMTLRKIFSPVMVACELMRAQT